MTRLLIIGAGAAGSVVAKKCAKNRDVFSYIHLASRSINKCENVKNECESEIEISQIDADNVDDMVKLIEKTKPDLLINMALPYQDLPVMEACLKTKTSYLDTANYEPKDVAKYEYSWQWAFDEKYKNNDILAILGCGFDPGVTGVFCAYANKHLFDEIHHVDIIDCNAGDHGKAFATNFNPEINIREITQNGCYFENGKWVETKPLEISKDIDFPEVGPKRAYLIYHEELESLVKNIPTIKSIRFWMTFGDEYIKHLQVLQNVGMTRIDPVNYNGCEVVPLQFLKALLPEPSSLSKNYTGKTSIGCVIEGIKDGERKKYIIYNVCSHEKSHQELNCQAVSYTTGVPATTAAIMFAKNLWQGNGVKNVEEFNPDPFLEELAKQGLQWHVKELKD